MLQGYLFSKPLPADEFAVLLQEDRVLGQPVLQKDIFPSFSRGKITS